MMYKAFAAITLVAAPIIVLVTQSVLPTHPTQPDAPAVQPALSEVAPVVPPAPVVTSVAPAINPASLAFGEPTPDAGKPSLIPGSGPPGGEVATQPSQPEPVGADGSDLAASDGALR